MPLPEFTAEEQYLVMHVKSTKSGALSSFYALGYMCPCVLIAGFAAYHESILMMSAAFLVLIGFRVYEERSQAKWIPVWRSIIAKYEAASMQSDDVTSCADHH